MQGKHFALAFHIPGTLAADITLVFKVPFACQLVKISAVATNDSAATLKAGTTGSTAAYLAEAAIGDSSVPVEFGQANFVGGEFPHIPDDTVVQLTLDYNGDGGTAAQNVTIVATFTEG